MESIGGAESTENLSINEQLSEAMDKLSNLPRPIVYGSVGRRLAMSCAKTFEEYLRDPRYPPRPNVNARIDIDFAVPMDAIPWSELQQFCQEIENRYPDIEMDPHYIEIVYDENNNPYYVSRKTGRGLEETISPLNTVEIRTNNGTIETFDVCGHIVYSLSRQDIRKKDLAEVGCLIRNVVEDPDSKGYDGIRKAVQTASRNRDLLRYFNKRLPYRLVVPRSIRDKMSKMRGRHIQDGISPVRNINSETPSFL